MKILGRFVLRNFFSPFAHSIFHSHIDFKVVEPTGLAQKIEYWPRGTWVPPGGVIFVKSALRNWDFQNVNRETQF